MFNRILVAINGTAQCDKVLQLAMKVAQSGSRIHVVCVISAEYCAPDVASQDASPAARREQLRAEGIIANARYLLTTQSIENITTVIEGVPEQAIAAHARDLDCDLIVMGHHHLSTFERVTGNSVAYSVLESSPCPILIEVG